MHEIIAKMFEGENPKSVLEIGCAGGPFLEQLRENYGDIKVGGIDICKSDLESAKQRFPKYADNFILHNLEDPWPIEDNTYDIIFSVGVLMYIFEPENVIREMLRVCKKKIIIGEFHHDSLDEYGGLAKIMLGDKVTGVGINRNYIKLLQKMRLEGRIKYHEAKAIIEVNKNKSNDERI